MAWCRTLVCIMMYSVISAKDLFMEISVDESIGSLKSFSVTCFYKTLKKNEDTFIQMSIKKDSVVLAKLSNCSVVSMVTKTASAQAFGQLADNVTKETYLRLAFQKPISSLSGKFVCSVVFKNKYGEQIIRSAELSNLKIVKAKDKYSENKTLKTDKIKNLEIGEELKREILYLKWQQGKAFEEIDDIKCKQNRTETEVKSELISLKDEQIIYAEQNENKIEEFVNLELNRSKQADIRMESIEKTQRKFSDDLLKVNNDLVNLELNRSKQADIRMESIEKTQRKFSDDLLKVNNDLSRCYGIVTELKNEISNFKNYQVVTDQKLITLSNNQANDAQSIVTLKQTDTYLSQTVNDVNIKLSALSNVHIETGKYYCGRTAKNFPIRRNGSKEDTSIYFRKLFTKPPLIFQFVNFEDVDRRSNSRWYIEHYGQTSSGFVGRCATWDDTVIHRLEIVWVAIEADKIDLY